jgi:hypothetical protein
MLVMVLPSLAGDGAIVATLVVVLLMTMRM